MPLSRYFPEEEMRKQITPSLLFTDDFSLERHGTKQAHEFNKIVSEHSEGGSTIHPETDKITEWLILFADQESWSQDFGQCDKVDSRTLTKEIHP